MTTKEMIIFESLKLFSENGFDGVSTRMIARAIHCSDAVIYKHFKSKQEILNQIIKECSERYIQKRDSVQLENLCWKDIEAICMDMFQFQTTDEWITLFRKLLIIEQYKNSEIAQLYKDLFINAPIQSMAKMFQVLIQMGYMKQGTPEVYAMELYAPFFMYHMTGADSNETMEYLREHVTRFRESVMTKKCFLEE